MPDFGRVSLIDTSSLDDAYVNSIEEDPARERLLYPGTNHGPALPTGSGLQRARWDLRTEPAGTFSGMILWGVRTMVPAAPPGTYTVRLMMGAATETAQVEVNPHPWITDVTVEDLQAQYAFGVRIRDQVDAANSAVIAIRDVKAELGERLVAAPYDESLIGTAERLRTAASAVGGDIVYQARNHLTLLLMAERGDGRPGSGMYAVFDIVVERLGGVMRERKGVWEGELDEIEGSEVELIVVVEAGKWKEMGDSLICGCRGEPRGSSHTKGTTAANRVQHRFHMGHIQSISQFDQVP